MAVMSVSLFVILGIATTIYGRPRFEDEQQMIKEFFPALLDRLQNNPKYAFLLGSDDLSSNRRQQISPVQQQVNWPTSNLKLGQVAGVAVDKNGDVLVFHRDNRTWGRNTFNYNNQLSQGEKRNGPIQNPTILRLDKNGTVIQSLGENKFYMPHGLTVDKDGNLWVTDVGLHQVMKIRAGSNKVDLELGKKLEPGSGIDQFCKPTDVAVASNGHFFVADGYCNGRIMKFTEDGKLLKQWGRPPQVQWGRAEDPAPDELSIPHSLTLLEDDDLICVADREHGRVQCFKAGIKEPKDTGKFVKSIKDSQFGRVFAISYDPIDKKMYLVNGATGDNQVSGFTINMNVDQPAWGDVQEPAWGPKNYKFDEPHDIAVSPDGKNVYVAEIRPDRLSKFNK